MSGAMSPFGLPSPRSLPIEEAHPVAKRKILIVADEVLVGGELEVRLTSLEYEVAAVASSGGEAVAMTAQAAPDLVLMDMVPRGNMNSVGAAHELRRHWKIPVVFMIAETDEASLRRAGVTELFGYVAKPCTDRELRVIIELALCKHDAARAVHEMEDRFFANSIDLLCFLDFNGHFKQLNPAWEQTLGFTRKELMSRPFIEFVHPDDRERTLEQNARVRGGGQALAFENRYLCKDGSYRWFRWNAASGSTERVIYSVARDVTASKQAEDEREQLVRELQDALAEVKTLLEILPICSYCRKIRDDENYWHTVESYFSQHTTTQFSHGICPSCMVTEFEPQLDELERE
jgi:PAS domain S-box-containing protein